MKISSPSWLSKANSPASQGALFAIVFIAVTNITIFFIYVRSVEAVKAEIREGLVRNVSAAATTLDGDQHKLFKSKASIADPAYIDLTRRLEKLRKASTDIRYLYTNVIDKSGNVFFVVNGSPQNDNNKDGRPDDAPQLMDPYPDAGQALLKALIERKPTVDSEPYTDAWGTFYSAYAPFYDSKGNFVGTLGMDLELVALNARLAPIGVAAQRAAFTSSILAVLFGTSVWYFRRTQKSLVKRRLQAETNLQVITDGRVQEREASAIQLAAVAKRFGNAPPLSVGETNTKDVVGYGQALQEYAKSRLRGKPDIMKNFAIRPLFESLSADNIGHQICLKILPNVPHRVYGSEEHLYQVLKTLVSHPYSITNLGTPEQISVDIENETLKSLALAVSLGFRLHNELSNFSVTSPRVNEASKYAVFNITACAGEMLSLGLANSKDPNLSHADISEFTIEFSIDGGLVWMKYTWNGINGDRPTVPREGLILVRVDISSENDDEYEGAEVFLLTVLADSGPSINVIATILDDGSGDVFNPDGTVDFQAIKDDDRASNSVSTTLSDVINNPESANHIIDEGSLAFATVLEQIRSISGSIKLKSTGILQQTLVITLPFSKYHED
jgi:hypothetical protein